MTNIHQVAALVGTVRLRRHRMRVRIACWYPSTGFHGAVYMLHCHLRHRLRIALLIPPLFLATLTIGFVSAKWTGAAEVVQLNPENWDEYAPAGKEADCIYGDYVMRSDRIIAVVGEAIPTRNANFGEINLRLNQGN